ncbi:tyrosine phosphatase [Pestalotiopsis sp. NC0098]|nr:tyrosine phosphatase [Pestalotiopsis sp. NC0098]
MAAPAISTSADPGLPSPPFIFVEGIPNFRDIGGYPIADQPGKVVREGIVFRSSEPSKVTEAGVAKLQALRVTDVYDLRSRQEIDRDARNGHGRQPKEWPGATRIFAPVFLDDDYSPEAIAVRFKNYADKTSEGFVQAYQDILNAVSSPQNEAQPYRTILKHLAAPSTDGSTLPAPVLLHCSAGKDRTGVICALVLSLCGVDDDVVAHEYSLTDLGLKSRHPEFLRHLMKEPALAGNPLGARRMIGSRKENMIETLKKIRSIWGSVEKCVVELNFLTDEEIKQLRKTFIVDASSQEGSPLDWRKHADLVAAAQRESDADAKRIAAEAQI